MKNEHKFLKIHQGLSVLKKIIALYFRVMFTPHRTNISG
jgi:hypothetical protein